MPSEIIYNNFLSDPEAAKKEQEIIKYLHKFNVYLEKGDILEVFGPWEQSNAEIKEYLRNFIDEAKTSYLCPTLESTYRNLKGEPYSYPWRYRDILHNVAKDRMSILEFIDHHAMSDKMPSGVYRDLYQNEKIEKLSKKIIEGVIEQVRDRTGIYDYEMLNYANNISKDEELEYILNKEGLSGITVDYIVNKAAYKGITLGARRAEEIKAIFTSTKQSGPVYDELITTLMFVDGYIIDKLENIKEYDNHKDSEYKYSYINKFIKLYAETRDVESSIEYCEKLHFYVERLGEDKEMEQLYFKLDDEDKYWVDKMLHEKTTLFNAKEQDKFTDIYYELGKNLILSEVVKMISGEPLLEKEEMKIILEKQVDGVLFDYYIPHTNNNSSKQSLIDVWWNAKGGRNELLEATKHRLEKDAVLGEYFEKYLDQVRTESIFILANDFERICDELKEKYYIDRLKEEFKDIVPETKEIEMYIENEKLIDTEYDFSRVIDNYIKESKYYQAAEMVSIWDKEMVKDYSNFLIDKIENNDRNAEKYYDKMLEIEKKHNLPTEFKRELEKVKDVYENKIEEKGQER